MRDGKDNDEAKSSGGAEETLVPYVKGFSDKIPTFPSLNDENIRAFLDLATIMLKDPTQVSTRVASQIRFCFLAIENSNFKTSFSVQIADLNKKLPQELSVFTPEDGPAQVIIPEDSSPSIAEQMVGEFQNLLLIFSVHQLAAKVAQIKHAPLNYTVGAENDLTEYCELAEEFCNKTKGLTDTQRGMVYALLAEKQSGLSIVSDLMHLYTKYDFGVIPRVAKNNKSMIAERVQQMQTALAGHLKNVLQIYYIDQNGKLERGIYAKAKESYEGIIINGPLYRSGVEASGIPTFLENFPNASLRRAEEGANKVKKTARFLSDNPEIVKSLWDNPDAFRLADIAMQITNAHSYGITITNYASAGAAVGSSSQRIARGDAAGSDLVATRDGGRELARVDVPVLLGQARERLSVQKKIQEADVIIIGLPTLNKLSNIASQTSKNDWVVRFFEERKKLSTLLDFASVSADGLRAADREIQSLRIKVSDALRAISDNQLMIEFHHKLVNVRNMFAPGEFFNDRDYNAFKINTESFEGEKFDLAKQFNELMESVIRNDVSESTISNIKKVKERLAQIETEEREARDKLVAEREAQEQARRDAVTIVGGSKVTRQKMFDLLNGLKRGEEEHLGRLTSSGAAVNADDKSAVFAAEQMNRCENLIKLYGRAATYLSQGKEKAWNAIAWKLVEKAEITVDPVDWTSDVPVDRSTKQSGFLGSLFGSSGSTRGR